VQGKWYPRSINPPLSSYLEEGRRKKFKVGKKEIFQIKSLNKTTNDDRGKKSRFANAEMMEGRKRLCHTDE
jgi:hypothetical protein